MAGIYVHIPICASRCYYCDFYSSTYQGNRRALLDAIKNELQMRQDYLKGEPVHTIYFGGGTPTSLTEDELRELVETIHSLYDCRIEEMTIEANPEDLTDDYVDGLLRLPFNRVSLGVQSFDNEDLKRVNRRHSAEDAIAAVKRLQNRGLTNISIDLIYGLPFQTIEKWEYNIKQAIGLQVPHVSAYHLGYEEGTMLTKMRDRGEVTEVDEELSLQMFKVLRTRLSEHGIMPYEISNFAKPGFESKHNSSYWAQVPYLGVGPSAHSFDGDSRQWNVANTRVYISSLQNGAEYYEREILDLNTRYNEYVMTALRRMSGVSLPYIAERFGTRLLDYFNRMMDPFVKDGHAIVEKDSVRLSEEGIFISDYIIETLLWVD